MKKALLTLSILFLGIGSAYSGKLCVGFAGGIAPSATHYDGPSPAIPASIGITTNAAGLYSALSAAKAGDTIFVAAGFYRADAREFVIKDSVVLIGGYDPNDPTLTRRYPGQFIPITSTKLDTTTQFTILDGNSLALTLPSQKHRVATVKGVLDGCFVRNGHARNSNGGGVYIDSGAVYNCIIRGNIAVCESSNFSPAMGGGAFIKGAGKLTNCVVAFNMANEGFGVASTNRTQGGIMASNNVIYNTYAPLWALVSGTAATDTFRMYDGGNYSYHPATIGKWTSKIQLSDFYMSRTLVTTGQYAVFCAAIDITTDSTRRIVITPYYKRGSIEVNDLRGLKDPANPTKTVASIEGTDTGRYFYPILTEAADKVLFRDIEKDRIGVDPGLYYDKGGWYAPTAITSTLTEFSTAEFPMGNVSWYGALAYSLWLGGGLPSEAQWEFAARRNPGGTRANLVNENLYSGAYGSLVNVATDNADTATWRILDSIAWVDGTRTIDKNTGAIVGGATGGKEVARKLPNALSIYDMTGLMYEWLGDYYVESDPYGGKTVKDPINKKPTDARVSRGGAWSESQRMLFALSRRNNTGTFSNIIGFRPVMFVPAP